MIQNVENGAIDWRNLIISATGIGAFNPKLPPAAFRISAAKTARIDAAANLFLTLRQVQFSSDKTVGQVMIGSEVVNNRIKQAIEDEMVTGKPMLLHDSTTHINAQMLLTGEIFSELYDASVNAIAEPMYGKKTGIIEPDTYTGLIVDCRGLQLAYAISPAIVDVDGNPLYNLDMAGQDAAIAEGIVQYITEDQLDSSRAGSNPLFIKVLRMSGKYQCDVVIAGEDAAEISQINTSQIFNQCRVVFLVE